MMEHLNENLDQVGINDSLDRWIGFDGQEFSHTDYCHEFLGDVRLVDHFIQQRKIVDTNLDLVSNITGKFF
jgi:hypothetical protein